MIITHLNLII